MSQFPQYDAAQTAYFRALDNEIAAMNTYGVDHPIAIAASKAADDASNRLFKVGLAVSDYCAIQREILRLKAQGAHLYNDGDDISNVEVWVWHLEDEADLLLDGLK